MSESHRAPILSARLDKDSKEVREAQGRSNNLHLQSLLDKHFFILSSLRHVKRNKYTSHNQ